MSSYSSFQNPAFGDYNNLLFSWKIAKNYNPNKIDEYQQANLIANAACLAFTQQKELQNQLRLRVARKDLLENCYSGSCDPTLGGDFKPKENTMMTPQMRKMQTLSYVQNYSSPSQTLGQKQYWSKISSSTSSVQNRLTAIDESCINNNNVL